jgi:hypothetical protein
MHDAGRAIYRHILESCATMEELRQYAGLAQASVEVQRHLEEAIWK